VNEFRLLVVPNVPTLKLTFTMWRDYLDTKSNETLIYRRRAIGGPIQVEQSAQQPTNFTIESFEWFSEGFGDTLLGDIVDDIACTLMELQFRTFWSLEEQLFYLCSRGLNRASDEFENVCLCSRK
jgi:hypothetical protein